MTPTLHHRDSWIFDLDGTLTVAVHDFDAIRAELGLPVGRTILETLDEMPAEAARPLRSRLGEIELDLARAAVAMDGAADLLSTLQRRGARLGILTRNSAENARETLRACGLDPFFDDESIVTRDEAPPKPSPEGIHRLLGRWSSTASRAVMAGDFLFDLQAGRAAGAATVYLDVSGRFEYGEHADWMVSDLRDLVRTITSSDGKRPSASP